MYGMGWVRKKQMSAKEKAEADRLRKLGYIEFPAGMMRSPFKKTRDYAKKTYKWI